MGTTVQSITGGRPLADAGLGQNNANGSFYGPGQRVGSWQQQQSQHSVGSPEAIFSPHVSNAAPPYANQAQSAYEAQQAAGLHQQQQRGISQLQSAATTAAGLPVPRNAQTPTPGNQAAGMNGGSQQPGMEKRGPVEFNHAISYVNKIKVCSLKALLPIDCMLISFLLFRIDSKISLRYTSSSSKYSKHTNGNRSQYRMYMRKLQHFSTRLQISLRTSSNFFRSLQPTQKRLLRLLKMLLLWPMSLKHHSRTPTDRSKRPSLHLEILHHHQAALGSMIIRSAAVLDRQARHPSIFQSHLAVVEIALGKPLTLTRGRSLLTSLLQPTHL